MDKRAISIVAAVCHEANRAWCAENGDVSQLGWEQAPDWQRESAEAGVQYLAEHPGAGVSALHDNWMRDKLAAGWVYGPVKDAESKTHPCLVPFEELPPVQQAKDALFAAIVGALLGTAVRERQLTNATVVDEGPAASEYVEKTPRGRRG